MAVPLNENYHKPWTICKLTLCISALALATGHLMIIGNPIICIRLQRNRFAISKELNKRPVGTEIADTLFREMSPLRKTWCDSVYLN